MKYIDSSEVAEKLRGKVELTTDPEVTDHMMVSTFERLCDDAVSQVELDLSCRYHVPFMTTERKGYDALPDVTRNIIGMLVRLKATITILEDDFVMGSASDATKTTRPLYKRYDAILARVIGKQDDVETPGSAQGLNWKMPPLACLRPAAFNTCDDGTMGQVFHSTALGNRTMYPASHVNSPGEVFGLAADRDVSGDWE